MYNVIIQKIFLEMIMIFNLFYKWRIYVQLLNFFYLCNVELIGGFRKFKSDWSNEPVVQIDNSNVNLYL